ncbi:MAG: helix-turn-helix transcriptional regulator [Lachnospiraceae bacterium]|nr:helix-turn-helix transcriptional regulator [Lachnospiraceae bacterium]
MDFPKITLRAARVNAGLTQGEAAQALHRTKQTIVNWESGATDIRYNDLCAMSELYHMPIEFISLPERKSSIRDNKEE